MFKDDCIFCKIAKGEIPSATVYETSEFKAFLDVSPANRGHALIIPKNHYDNLFQLDDETAAKIFAAAPAIARAIKEETGCEGLNIIQNNGEVAGQTVHHFHIHFVPRYKDDDVNVKWKHCTVTPEDAAELAAALNKRI